MSKMVTVKNDGILHLQFDAQGFRNAFYILYDSIMNVNEAEPWNQDGDCMAVLATSGCFSIELYLKFLAVIGSFDATTQSGKHSTGHCLDVLYGSLNQNYIKDLEKLYKEQKYEQGTLFDFLQKIKDGFIEWRYSYDEGPLNLNLNVLSYILNMLENYSLDKYRPISDKITISNNNNNQTLTFTDSSEIRKETWI